jgi:hypothetical protein
MMTNEKEDPVRLSGAAAPAKHAVEQRAHPDNSLVGRPFAHFSPGTDGRAGQVRFGVVSAQLGPDTYLLTFDAGAYSFSNVFSLQQLQSFVFFLTTGERAAFIADITAQQALQTLAVKTNAGRGRAGTMLDAGAA